MKQKRLENRDLCADLVKMSCTPNPEHPYDDWAILGDISPSGACLEIDEPIPVDTVVELEFGEDRCRAVVRYCVYDKVKYLLGVEFEPGYSWSSSRWEPKHLVRIYYTHEGGYHLLTAIFRHQKKKYRNRQSKKQ
ncbi:MAG: PilZ domain-containing protein [Acidobacteria bacterium]|nr:PilZ domain-containing protein [Acidobacteriota bacterium]